MLRILETAQLKITTRWKQQEDEEHVMEQHTYQASDLITPEKKKKKKTGFIITGVLEDLMNAITL